MNQTIILIPAYKPDEKLIALLKNLSAKAPAILVVDDGSGGEYDDVFAQAQQFATVLRYGVNRGKGGAMKYGMAYIREHMANYTYFITCDADGQHTPSDIEKVNAKMCAGKGDILIGSRAFSGKIPLRSRFGNSITRLVFASASRVWIRDTQTGLRAFKVADIPWLCSIDGDRYEYEINVLLQAAKTRRKLFETDIETVYIEGNKSSHFHPLRDSYTIYKQIIRFTLSSLTSFVLDYCLSLLFYRLLGSISFAAQTSIALGRLCSSVVNFTLNRKVVFQSDERISTALCKYYALATGILIVKELLVTLLHNVTCLPFWASNLLAELILFFINYIVQKRFIFPRRRKKSDA